MVCNLLVVALCRLFGCGGAGCWSSLDCLVCCLVGLLVFVGGGGCCLVGWVVVLCICC